MVPNVKPIARRRSTKIDPDAAIEEFLHKYESKPPSK
jgi:hypothetical protein